MLKHSLRIALRILQKRKHITFIHLFGLTAGIAVFWIIIQYVSFEKSYDQFHAKADQIFRIDIDFYRDGKLVDGDAMNYPPTGPAMVNELSEVSSFVRIHPEYRKVIFSRGETRYEENRVFYVDSTMFSIFDYTFLEGSPKDALKGENKLVLTISLAEKYFGPRNIWEESPVGQLVNFNNQRDFMISAIVEDSPETTHLKFNALISFETFLKEVGDVSDAWGWNDFYTYVLTTPGTTQSGLQSKLPAFFDRHLWKDHGNEFIATPLTNIHLYSHQSDEPETNGDIAVVNALMIIAFVILIIAWINYINLSTARSEERAKEVGIRKVTGAHQAGLVLQFLSEAFMLNLIAIIFSLLIAYLTLPQMGAVLGKDLTFDLLNEPAFWVGIIALLVGGTLFSGLYPAFVLSSFTPSYILTGSAKKLGHKDLFRKGLVVFQFATAIALIIGTIIIYNQINYLQRKQLGFNLKDKIIINAPGVYNNDSIFEKRYLTFKNEIEQIADVENVTISSAIPGGNLEYEVDVTSIKLEGSSDDQYKRVWRYMMDHDFIDAYNLRVIAGHKFLKNSNTTKGILNRSATKLLGYNNPADLIGKKFKNDGQMVEIVGVVEDYHHQSAKSAFLPMVMINDIQSMLYYTVNIGPSTSINPQTVLNNIQDRWLKVHPENPFSYFFLEDRYQYQYQPDLQTGKVFLGFSIFAILITCLGLLGLSSYMVITRTKEIGIRKVLGATRGQIIYILSKDFVTLLGFSALLAVPLGYHYFNLWLEGFAFRIDISIWLLTLPVIFVALLSLLIVSAFSLRAASLNPVETLRSK